MQNLEHIYEPLYVKGMYSDVTVHMLGKDWKLHKEIVKVVKHNNKCLENDNPFNETLKRELYY